MLPPWLRLDLRAPPPPRLDVGLTGVGRLSSARIGRGSLVSIPPRVDTIAIVGAFQKQFLPSVEKRVRIELGTGVSVREG